MGQSIPSLQTVRCWHHNLGLKYKIDLDRKSERTTNDVVINMLEFVAGIFFQLKL